MGGTVYGDRVSTVGHEECSEEDGGDEHTTV